MLLILVLSFVFITTYFGVALFRRWSLKRGLLDIPNDRSSHVIPTPRGGGLVIAITTTFAYVALSWLFGYNLSYGYLIGSLIIVIISSLDDAYSVSVAWRFLIHGIAAGILIYDVGYFRLIYIPVNGHTVDLGVIGIGLSLIWIIWLINSYNFMDGIDGIAGIQAVVAGLAWLIAGHVSGIPAVVIIGGVAMSSSIAFLFHNWQPARIFMGDVGSAFLGYTFAAVPLIFVDQLKEDSGLVPYLAVLFVWFFVFDSIFTFLKRLLKGEKVWRPHRQHIYQKLVIFGYSHQLVSSIYGVLGFGVAIPSAFLISEHFKFKLSILPVVVLATISLLFIYFRADRGHNNA